MFKKANESTNPQSIEWDNLSKNKQLSKSDISATEKLSKTLTHLYAYALFGDKATK